MPELPDIELYLHAMEKHIVGLKLQKLLIRSPFLLRSFEVDLKLAQQQSVLSVFHIGKRIGWQLSGDLYLVFHLMISGRFHKRAPNSLPKSKVDLAAFQFDAFTLMLTEAASNKRASLHLICGSGDLQQFEPGGLDLFTCSITSFAKRLRNANRTVKLVLIDPGNFDGIGNAYSDEILHAARMSPLQRTGNLSNTQVRHLLKACRTVLGEWRTRLIEANGERFPEKVTAFRPEMSVHGKFGEPCPVCGKTVQRIRFAEREWNYCAKCPVCSRMNGPQPSMTSSNVTNEIQPDSSGFSSSSDESIHTSLSSQ